MPPGVCADHHVIPQRLPEWLRNRGILSRRVHAMKRSLRRRALSTVCEEARCPNIGECFARGTATILIMGNACTRRCGFCAIAHGRPAPLDPGEPARVAGQIRGLSLSHAVVTSVTRDDLPDGGAHHFAATIRAIGEASPGTTIEVLTPDFQGREGDVATVCASGPDVFNHNVETVERLTPLVRDAKASYRRSLEVLKIARQSLPFATEAGDLPEAGGRGSTRRREPEGVRGGSGWGRSTSPCPSLQRRGKLKSGLMVGLGESPGEVRQTLADLAAVGCDIATVGQYLPPSREALPAEEYVAPARFREYEEMGRACGIPAVFSGPLVRSSYCADVIARNEVTQMSLRGTK